MRKFEILVIAAIMTLSACTGSRGPKGDPGDQGPTGATSLVRLDNEPAGTNCAGGGIAVKNGVDGNGNGTLDDAEVTRTAFICSGASGSSDTPAQVLAKLQTVDGTGSGLDADLLQGNTPAQLLSQFVPTGTVVAFAGNSVPAGWLLCDGRQVSRMTYAALFSTIGVIHGPGDSVSTFNLPDYRGRFLRGVDGTAGRDPDKLFRTVPIAGATGTGNAVGSVQLPATARPVTAFSTDIQGAHTHANGAYNRLLQLTGLNTSPGSDNTSTEPDIISSAPMSTAGSHSHSITGGDNETRPVNAYVNFIIKT